METKLMFLMGLYIQVIKEFKKKKKFQIFTKYNVKSKDVTVRENRGVTRVGIRAWFPATLTHSPHKASKQSK